MEKNLNNKEYQVIDTNQATLEAEETKFVFLNESKQVVSLKCYKEHFSNQSTTEFSGLNASCQCIHPECSTKTNRKLKLIVEYTPRRSESTKAECFFCFNNSNLNITNIYPSKLEESHQCSKTSNSAPELSKQVFIAEDCFNQAKLTRSDQNGLKDINSNNIYFANNISGFNIHMERYACNLTYNELDNLSDQESVQRTVLFLRTLLVSEVPWIFTSPQFLIRINGNKKNLISMNLRNNLKNFLKDKSESEIDDLLFEFLNKIEKFDYFWISALFIAKSGRTKAFEIFKEKKFQIDENDLIQSFWNCYLEQISSSDEDRILKSFSRYGFDYLSLKSSRCDLNDKPLNWEKFVSVSNHLHYLMKQLIYGDITASDGITLVYERFILIEELLGISNSSTRKLSPNEKTSLLYNTPVVNAVLMAMQVIKEEFHKACKFNQQVDKFKKVFSKGISAMKELAIDSYDISLFWLLNYHTLFEIEACSEDTKYQFETLFSSIFKYLFSLTDSLRIKEALLKSQSSISLKSKLIDLRQIDQPSHNLANKFKSKEKLLFYVFTKFYPDNSKSLPQEIIQNIKEFEAVDLSFRYALDCTILPSLELLSLSQEEWKPNNFVITIKQIQDFLEDGCASATEKLTILERLIIFTDGMSTYPQFEDRILHYFDGKTIKLESYSETRNRRKSNLLTWNLMHNFKLVADYFSAYLSFLEQFVNSSENSLQSKKEALMSTSNFAGKIHPEMFNQNWNKLLTALEPVFTQLKEANLSSKYLEVIFDKDVEKCAEENFSSIAPNRINPNFDFQKHYISAIEEKNHKQIIKLIDKKSFKQIRANNLSEKNVVALIESIVYSFTQFMCLLKNDNLKGISKIKFNSILKQVNLLSEVLKQGNKPDFIKTLKIKAKRIKIDDCLYITEESENRSIVENLSECYMMIFELNSNLLEIFDFASLSIQILNLIYEVIEFENRAKYMLRLVYTGLKKVSDLSDALNIDFHNSIIHLLTVLYRDHNISKTKSNSIFYYFTNSELENCMLTFFAEIEFDFKTNYPGFKYRKIKTKINNKGEEVYSAKDFAKHPSATAEKLVELYRAEKINEFTKLPLLLNILIYLENDDRSFFKEGEIDSVLIDFVKKLWRKVEINHNKKIIEINFVSEKYTDVVKMEHRTDIMKKICDVEDEDKVKEVVVCAENYHSYINKTFEYAQKSRVNRFFANLNYEWVMMVSMGIAVLNVILLLSTIDSDRRKLKDWSKNLIVFLQVIQIVIALLSMGFWFNFEFKLELSLARDRYILRNDIDLDNDSFLTNLKNSIIILLKSIETMEILGNTLILVTSVASIFQYNYPWVINIQLLCFIGMVNRGAELIKACFTNKAELLIIVSLILIVNLIFSSAIFAKISELFETSNKESLCETSFKCFLNILTHGLTSSGGIADDLRSIPVDNPLYWTRFAILISYLFFNVLIIAIFTGTVVDGFSKHMSKIEEIKKKTLTLCFVCRKNRDEIFNEGEQFRKHKNKRHNLFDYIFFLIKILNKTKGEREKYENSILNQNEEGITKWFPTKSRDSMEELQNCKEGIEEFKSSTQIKRYFAKKYGFRRGN